MRKIGARIILIGVLTLFTLNIQITSNNQVEFSVVEQTLAFRSCTQYTSVYVQQSHAACSLSLDDCTFVLDDNNCIRWIWIGSPTIIIEA